MTTLLCCYVNNLLGPLVEMLPQEMNKRTLKSVLWDPKVLEVDLEQIKFFILTQHHQKLPVWHIKSYTDKVYEKKVSKAPKIWSSVDQKRKGVKKKKLYVVFRKGNEQNIWFWCFFANVSIRIPKICPILTKSWS